MRKSNREITDLHEILGVLGRCSVCRLALFDGTYPYIVPLNFGFEAEDGRVTLWFHCAGQGKKLDLLQRNPSAAFEADIPARLILSDKACSSTMLYESVCGNGTLEIASDGEKLRGLTAVMRQYSERTAFDFDENEVKAVTVLKLTVNEITGKRLMKG